MSKYRVNISHDVINLRSFFITNVIRRCVESVMTAEGVNIPCEINVLITNDKGIQAINRASREIDKPTDVLSFPMFQLEPGIPPEGQEFLDPETQMCPLGDMAISLERAVAHAEEIGHSVRREVGYLTIHSMLHLLGYDHLDEGEQKAQMRAREEAIAATVKGVKRP